MTPGQRERRVRRACVAAAGAGAAGLLAVAWLTGGRLEHPWIALGFLVAMIAAEHFPLHVTHEGDSEALRLEEAFFVPMAVLLAPLEVAVVIGLSTAVVHGTRRRGVLKGLFNVGMITAAVAAGLGTAQAVGLDGPLGARSLGAAVLGGLVFGLVSALAVSGIISLAQGAAFREVLADGAGVRTATWLGSLSLGALVAMAADRNPVALLVALVPAVVLQVAYSGALRQWRERRQAEALYEAAGRIRAGVASAQVRAELVAAARQLLSAGSARVVHDAAEPAAPGALRAPLDDGAAVEVAGRATGGDWTRQDATRLQALAAVASGALSHALLHEQLQAVAGSLGEGVLGLDSRGEICFVNPAAARMLGWEEADLLGRHVAAAVDPGGLTPQPDGTAGWVHLPRLQAGETLRVEEYALARSDGSTLDAALTASPVVRDGEVVGAVLALRDVGERKALERRLTHQALHDQLTGLPNRALFLDRLEHACARRSGAQAVLFVDLDRFKAINDSLGHRIGDDVLRVVGSRLSAALQPGDTVARFGGDEFTVLLEQDGSRAEVLSVAQRLLHELALPLVAGGREVVLTASIGIAVAEPGALPHDLLAAADIAMYEAKSAGSGRCAVARAGAGDRARERLELELELRRAIEQGQLELEYQPVVAVEGEALHGFEALVRWRHPRLGLLPPSQFMAVAEETGLVLPLGEWVLEQACAAARRWHEQHPGTGAVMAVNLSARQFQDPDLRERVEAALDRAGLSPDLLTLEITETVVMQDGPRALDTLHALRDLGVRLAIDDFGTGYSSLSYLKRFPVDVVKIDRSFVEGLATDLVDREIVAAVIRLAHAVGMQTVAEGVETDEQLEQLRRLGCSLAQGYLISRPQPLPRLEQRLGQAVAAGLPVPRAAGDAGRPGRRGARLSA